MGVLGTHCVYCGVIYLAEVCIHLRYFRLKVFRERKTFERTVFCCCPNSRTVGSSDANRSLTLISALLVSGDLVAHNTDVVRSRKHIMNMKNCSLSTVLTTTGQKPQRNR